MLGGFGAGKPVDAEVSSLITGLKADVEKASGWVSLMWGYGLWIRQDELGL